MEVSSSSVRIGHPLTYAVIRKLTEFYLRLKGGLRIVGAENLPTTGGIILAPNHVSYLDPPAISIGLKRRMASMAKAELWKNKFFGKIMDGVAAFPVHRGASDREAIRTGLKRLEDGHPLLLFPEGTRGDGVTLGKFNSGAALFARRSGAPVVPIAVHGTESIMPREGKGKRAKTTLVYGKPFLWSEESSDDKFNERLQREIIALAAANGWTIKPPESGSEAPSE